MTEHLLRVLLLQARRATDPMAAHEVACVRARLHDHPVTLRIHNCLAQPATPDLLDHADAFIVGGSGEFSVNHPHSRPWADPIARVIEAALERQRPGFLICFGHQLLGQVLGHEVVTSSRKTEVGTIQLERTAASEDDPIFGTLPQRLLVHTGHSDHVVGVPAGVELMMRGDEVETQAFKVRGAPIYSVQFHPDLTGGEARERYLSIGRGLEGSALAAVRERAHRFQPHHDESTVLLARFVDHAYGHLA